MTHNPIWTSCLRDDTSRIKWINGLESVGALWWNVHIYMMSIFHSSQRHKYSNLQPIYLCIHSSMIYPYRIEKETNHWNRKWSRLQTTNFAFTRQIRCRLRCVSKQQYSGAQQMFFSSNRTRLSIQYFAMARMMIENASNSVRIKNKTIFAEHHVPFGHIHHLSQKS